MAEKIKNKGGRPIKYTDDFISKEAEALLEYANSAPLPFLKDFCIKRGYGSQRISEFVHVKEFSEALNRLKDAMEVKLVFGALANKLNSYMAMNTLKNVAGWRDKHEVEHSGGYEVKVIHAEVEERITCLQSLN